MEVFILGAIMFVQCFCLYMGGVGRVNTYSIIGMQCTHYMMPNAVNEQLDIQLTVVHIPCTLHGIPVKC